MLDNFPEVDDATDGSVTVPGYGPILPGSDDSDWGVLYMRQVYFPDKVDAADAYKYRVPRPGQLIIDTENDIFYVCVSVDTEGKTLAPTLRIINTSGSSSGSGTASVDYDYDKDIFGIESGFQGEGVVCIDYSTYPNTANIDRQIMCPGASYALLYKGTTIQNSYIVSAVYTSSGVLTSDHIPLKLAAIDTLDNKTIMTTESFSVRLNAEELPAGTKCTLLFFDSAGNHISRARILNVQHTTVLADHNVSKKYIRSVELIAPYFTNSTNPGVLNIPINTQIKTIMFSALITYSDGTTVNRFIDGQKISLLGLDSYTPTAPNQFSWITLCYRLDSDELIYEAQPGVTDKYTKDYQIFSLPFDGAYSPKIYTLPQWDGTTYNLRHFLTDLDRAFALEVTDKVYLNDSSPAFKPNSYGVEQSLEFNLRLSDASANFKHFIMRQPITITLKRGGEEVGSRWDLRYSYLGNTYSDPGLVALRHLDGTRIDASAGCETQDEWISKMYSNLEPAYNPSREKKPPTPTHFELIDSKYRVWRFPVTDWNKQLILEEDVVHDTLLVIRWLKVDADGSIAILAVGGGTILTSTLGLSTTLEVESDIHNSATTTMIDYMEVTP